MKVRVLILLASFSFGCPDDDPPKDDTAPPPDDTSADTGEPDDTDTTPPPALEGTLCLTEADAVIQDASGAIQLGSTVASAGDVDGDGQDDLLVASYTCDGGASASYFPGCVHLFLGPVDGDRGPEDAIATLQGPWDTAWAGYDMASAGDVNGDGYGDLLVSSSGGHHGEEDAQAAWLVHGPLEGHATLDEADLVLLPAVDGDASGQAVAVGDIDGDGALDLAVGAPQDPNPGRESGTVYLISATLEGRVSLADAKARIQGESVTGHAGAALNLAEDIDGDGVGDLVIGAPQDGWSGEAGDDVPGAAYLFLGPLAGSYTTADADTRFVADGMDAAVGRGVCGVGDTDGDGAMELAIGAQMYTGVATWGGVVAVFRAPVGGDRQLADAELLIHGHEQEGWIGRQMANVGDIDGDGRDDLLVGSMFSNEPYAWGGRAYLHTDLGSGVTDTSSATATFEANESNVFLGVTLSGAGDQNGDGVPDILIGTRDMEAEGRIPGAYLFFGG